MMRWLGLTGCVVLVLGCGKEGEFQGKSASHWIGQLEKKEPYLRNEAILALGEIGPGAKKAIGPLSTVARGEEKDLRIQKYPLYPAPAARLDTKNFGVEKCEQRGSYCRNETEPESPFLKKCTYVIKVGKFLLEKKY